MTRWLTAGALLWLSVASCAVAQASASSLAVGNLSRPVKDTVAVLTEFFGKPTIEVYLFSKVLSAHERQAVAIGGSNVASTIGISPLGTLMFFFKEGARQCSGNLLSYTVVFRKSKSFPIRVITDSPINWAYASNDMSDYGLDSLECSLAHGARIEASVAHQHTLDKAFEAKFFQKPALPSGVDSLLFQWNATIDSTIVDKEAAFQETAIGRSLLRIDTADVVDSDAIFLRKYRALSFRIYRSRVSMKDRGERASADAASQLGYVYVTIGDRGGQPVVTYCSIAISEARADGGRHDHAAECNDPSHALRVSGRFEQGQSVKLEMKGLAAPSAALKRPRMEWDLALESVIDGVFDE